MGGGVDSASISTRVSPNPSVVTHSEQSSKHGTKPEEQTAKDGQAQEMKEEHALFGQEKHALSSTIGQLTTGMKQLETRLNNVSMNFDSTKNEMSNLVTQNKELETELGSVKLEMNDLKQLLSKLQSQSQQQAQAEAQS